MFGDTLISEKNEKTLSKVGRKPIPIPAGVTVSLDYKKLTVSGPQGTLDYDVHSGVEVNVFDGEIRVERKSSSKFHRSLHGLARSLIANMVIGTSQGYEKTLELMGVGYRVQSTETGIVLNVGFSHSVEITSPQGVNLTVEGNNKIHVTGIDKQKVGQLAAIIRKVRPPNPYKEKGIKYSGEVLHLKPGKAASRKT